MKNRTCEVCGTSGSIKQLENHRKKGLCEQTLWRKQVDKLLEKNGGGLRCPECNDSFGKMWILYNHIRTTLCGGKLGLQRQLSTCPHCKKSFTTPQTLKLHLANGACKTPTCEYCGQEFKSKPTLAAHVRKGCPQAEERHEQLSLDEAASVNASKAPVYGERHQCLFCSKYFRSPSALEDHMRSHTGERPFFCPECNNEFATKYSMKRHQKSHKKKTDKRVKKGPVDELLEKNGEECHHCLLCSKGFRSPVALEQHMRNHTGERPFFCPEFGKEFVKKSSVKSHQKSHRKKTDNRVKKKPVDKLLEKGGESLACLHCKKDFAEVKQLRAHYLYTSCGIQLGLPRSLATCPHCQKPFQSPYACQLHLAKGSCKTPTCEICGREFESKGSLAAHVRKGCPKAEERHEQLSLDAAGNSKVYKAPAYGDRYQCLFCSKFLGSPSALEGHMRIHIRERPYFCPECNKEFATNYSMQQHRELHKKPPMKEPVDELLEKDDGSLACLHCKNVFAKVKSLRLHYLYTSCGIKLGLERSLPTCPDCNESFINPQALNRHVENEVCKTPKCKECGKEFEHALSLTAHVRSGCLKGEDGTCKECGEVFYDKIRLEKHLLNHELEAAAQVAAANAKASRALKNIDRYQCLFCSKVFESKSNLEIHMRKHTRERPFFCPDPECGKEYNTNHNMQQHYQDQHLWKRAIEMEACKPVDPDAEDHYTCGRCNYVGHTQSAMINHVKLIHRLIVHPDTLAMWEQGFKKKDLSPEADPSWKVEGTCYVCGKNFYCSGLLLIHIRRCEKKHKVWDVIGCYRSLVAVPTF